MNMPEETALYITEFKLLADVKQVDPVRSRFIEFLLSLGLDDREKEGWKLAFTELIINAICYGCHNNQELEICVRWWSANDSIWLLLQDPGQGPPEEYTINPSLPEDPLAEGGRGLYIINEFADTFDHWRCSRGYIAQMSKSYKRLNDVLPPNEEMDAILEELSDSYESQSLYQIMAAHLAKDERVDLSVQSVLNDFMDGRDFTSIHLEIYACCENPVYTRLSEIDSYGCLGQINDKAKKILKENDSINWSPSQSCAPFTELDDYPTGCAVPLYADNQIIGVIAVGCVCEDHKISSKDIHNLRGLSDIIGVLIDRALRDSVKGEQKRLETELSIATDLQQKLVPIDKLAPEIPGYDLFFNSLSALEVAGDFVEVRQSSSGEYVGCVIDVMGKGVSAAILAGIFRSQFIAYAYRGGNLATFLESVNQVLESQLEGATMFITAFVFKLNLESHEFTYAAAGHPPALFFATGGSLKKLISTGPPVGLFPGIEFSQKLIKLSSGDRIVIVTDGLYEWTQGKDIFGWDKMVEWFISNRHLAADALWAGLQDIMLRARKQQDIEQEDDETLLILTRK
jgi:serine phosphatase RsbU (regulator of sigma subunit)/anti-sigma regulatory factor (Ser/Thr protein kinase)